MVYLSLLVSLFLVPHARAGDIPGVCATFFYHLGRERVLARSGDDAAALYERVFGRYGQGIHPSRSIRKQAFEYLVAKGSDPALLDAWEGLSHEQLEALLKKLASLPEVDRRAVLSSPAAWDRWVGPEATAFASPKAEALIALPGGVSVRKSLYPKILA